MEQTTTQQTTPLQPPVNHTDESMWSSFQTVLTFIALGFFAGATFSIWSTAINTLIPNKLDTMYQYIGATLINGAIATLIVSAPVFIGLFFWTNKKYAELPELKKNKSKKLLNYLTLIITFVILLAQTITAITTALNDAFTLNFGLQLLLTFLVCGTIFGYYLFEVRFEKKPASKNVYAIACLGLLILTVVTLGVSFKIRSDLKLKAAQQPNPYAPINEAPLKETQPIVRPTNEPMQSSERGSIN